MTKIFDQDKIIDWHEDTWDDLDGVVVDRPVDFQRRPRKGRSVRWLAALAGMVLLCVVIFAAAFAIWFMRQVNPPGKPGDQVAIVVADGMGIDDIATTLETKGIIDRAWVFKWYATRKGTPPAVQAGTYRIRTHDSYDKILSVLRTPPELVFTKVTIPEGFTLEQIAARLTSRIPSFSAEKFLALARSGSATSTLAPAGTQILEGLLFPDTYQIAETQDEASVLSMMVDLMDRVASKEQVDRSSNPYDTLKIASIIEREAKTDADRPKIARVIYNRLFLGMPLQIDATVLYAVPGDQTVVTEEMKAFDSPYNTYKYTGLPPTPISSASRASIRAAMNPADGPWLYYVVSDKDGNHAFAETYEEHLVNVERARAAGLLG